MQVNKGVRVFANQGCAAMGYDLPAAIGAVVSNEAKENDIKEGWIMATELVILSRLSNILK